ncbi:hypothetical protein KEJ51_00630 [Candidatus Bathyarchaeota archaeon]|nr:hypothetical protein [Candidatus Bathyarchaeota archaeon]MBS7628681.1 hypothetical protein [Candidatus Bathyarchaeota archaeon]
MDRIVRDHPELNYNRQQFVESALKEKRSSCPEQPKRVKILLYSIQIVHSSNNSLLNFRLDPYTTYISMALSPA